MALQRSNHILSPLRNTDLTKPTAFFCKPINSRRLCRSFSRLCSMRSLFRGLSRLPRTTSTQWSSRSNRLLTPLCSMPISTLSATLLPQEDIRSLTYLLCHLRYAKHYATIQIPWKTLWSEKPKHSCHQCCRKYSAVLLWPCAELPGFGQHSGCD
jgi:hypothetical protein